MATLAAIIEKLNELKHQEAIWQEVSNHLLNFVGSETHDPEAKLNTPDLGTVPQTLIQVAINLIQEQLIKPTQTEIAQLAETEIPDVKDEKATKKGSSGEGTAEKGRKGPSGLKTNIPRAGGLGHAKDRGRNLATGGRLGKPAASEPEDSGEEP
jgi:hypothetical protein